MEVMDGIREAMSKGQLELASLGADNQPRPVDYQTVRKKVELNNRMAELGKELEGLSWEERYEWVNIMKLKGNRLYSDGNYQKAVQVYMDSLIGLDFSDQSRLKIVKEELQYPLLMNMSTCFYKLEQCERGLALCETVLKEQPTHVKALFKKGGHLVKLGRFEEARQCFDSALKEKPEADLRNSILHEQQQLRNKVAQSQTCYKKMFEQEEEPSDAKPLLVKTAVASVSASSKIPDPSEVLYYQEPTLLARLFNCLKQLVRRNRRSSLHND